MDLDIYLALFIVIPLLILTFFYSIKESFIEDYNPYGRLTDIKVFQDLINNNAKGMKRFLAAIEYERLKNVLLFIFDDQTIFLGVFVYIFIVIGNINTLGVKKTVGTVIINIVVITFPAIITSISVMLKYRIKLLKKQIGD